MRALRQRRRVQGKSRDPDRPGPRVVRGQSRESHDDTTRKSATQLRRRSRESSQGCRYRIRQRPRRSPGGSKEGDPQMEGGWPTTAANAEGRPESGRTPLESSFRRCGRRRGQRRHEVPTRARTREGEIFSARALRGRRDRTQGEGESFSTSKAGYGSGWGNLPACLLRGRSLGAGGGL